MKHSSLTLGQIEAHINMLGGAQVLLDHIAGKLEVSVKVLMRLGELTQGALIASRKKFDPKKAFTTSRGHRWLSENMTGKILPLSKPMTEVPEIVTNYRTLEINTSEWDIMEEFPECVYSDINLLLAHVDSLTALQLKGESHGDLLVDNYKANFFFFVPDPNKPRVGFVVNAYWRSDASEWDFRARPLDGYVWNAGNRVFGYC